MRLRIKPSAGGRLQGGANSLIDFDRSILNVEGGLDWDSGDISLANSQLSVGTPSGTAVFWINANGGAILGSMVEGKAAVISVTANGAIYRDAALVLANADPTSVNAAIINDGGEVDLGGLHIVGQTYTQSSGKTFLSLAQASRIRAY